MEVFGFGKWFDPKHVVEKEEQLNALAVWRRERARRRRLQQEKENNLTESSEDNLDVKENLIDNQDHLFNVSENLANHISPLVDSSFQENTQKLPEIEEEETIQHGLVEVIKLFIIYFYVSTYFKKVIFFI